MSSCRKEYLDSLDIRCYMLKDGITSVIGIYQHASRDGYHLGNTIKFKFTGSASESKLNCIFKTNDYITRSQILLSDRASLSLKKYYTDRCLYYLLLHGLPQRELSNC